MKTTTFLLSIICLWFIGQSCAPTQKAEGSLKENTDDTILHLQQQVQAQYGEDYTCTPSPANSYLLCSQVKTSEKQPMLRLVHALVYDMATQQLVHEQRLESGTIKWYSDYQLEILRIPGILAANQNLDDYTTIYNVKTKESILKSKMAE